MTTLKLKWDSYDKEQVGRHKQSKIRSSHDGHSKHTYCGYMSDVWMTVVKHSGSILLWTQMILTNVMEETN